MKCYSTIQSYSGVATNLVCRNYSGSCGAILIKIIMLAYWFFPRVTYVKWRCENKLLYVELQWVLIVPIYKCPYNNNYQIILRPEWYTVYTFNLSGRKLLLNISLLVNQMVFFNNSNSIGILPWSHHKECGHTYNNHLQPPTNLQ